MNQTLLFSNRLLLTAIKINKYKDEWLESRIKSYAENVKKRYPNQLTFIEKLLSPIIFSNITGTVANLITSARLLLAIIIFVLQLIAYPFSSFDLTLTISIIVFVFASFLDLLDGPVARALNEISDLGKWLDPLADKILLASVLLLLGYVYLPSITFWLIVGQELFIVFIATIKLLAEKLPFIVASQANLAGKIKNVFELTAGTFLILTPLSKDFGLISNYLFLISIVFGISSIISYLLSVRRKI